MNKLNAMVSVLVKVIFKAIFSIHIVAYASSAMAEVVLVDLSGTAPEEASITVSVSKPGNAVNALIRLNVYDADIKDEGELIINGNPAIALFGSAATGANDNKSANITLSTPAAYWRDGKNTLVFRHTRTGGYTIDEVTVQFEVDPAISSDPAPETVVGAESLPVDLTGTAPEEASITVSVSKPGNAVNGLITMNVYDADIKDEGELIINGHPAVALFGSAAAGANDNKSANITLSTPAAYWRDGNNTLVFRHTRTGGYAIDEMTVQFEVDPAISSDPAPETVVGAESLPVDLTGTAPEEASITVSVSKPGNAVNGLITMNVYDADIKDEGELIINGHPAVALFGSAAAGANDNKSANITLSTPAAYWRDGNNTLVFRHTRTGGYAIDEMVVQFEVDATVSSEPEPEPAPAPAPAQETVVDAKSLPIDLTGAAPEEASITVSVSKPGNATKGLIKLNVYDPDFKDEGELIINGNPAVALFGSAASSSYDGKSVNVTLSTPAAYWRDGNNTLVFRHTRTGGFVINEMVVQFEVDVTVSPEPAAEPAPTPTAEPAPAQETVVDSQSLPIDLYGVAPEEASITVSVNKPSNATKGLINLNVYDADIKDEGELIINGNPAIALFGSAATGANDNKSANITLSTPAAYWRDGNNTLVFRHTRTGGFVIEEMVVLFEVDATVSTEPATEPEPAPAPPETVINTQSLPIDLTGTAPEEASITVSVNKPSNATNGLIKLNVYDADIKDEGELIINGHPAVALFGAAATGANDNKSANITLSTPASYWRDGNNTLVFRHTRTGGYVIDEMVVLFEVDITASPEPESGPGSVSLGWAAPAERTDGSALSLSEISGYTVYYGTSEGNYSNSLSVNDGSATSAIVADLPVGTYYMVVTSRDNGGRESEYSGVIIKQSK